MSTLEDILTALADFLCLGDFFSHHPIIRLLCITALVAAILLVLLLLCT